MSVHQVEAVVLRTWPIHEADQIVSLFTRDFGKIKGVAKSAARSRRRFGGALEPMTHVRAHYAEKPSQELVRLDSFEILHSPLAEPVDYARATALAFFAEVLEQTLPDHDPHDVVFRLLLSVLEQTRVDHIWMPITYFALWTTRLMGWLPDLSRCLFCGASLAGQPAYFHFFSDGLVCVEHKQMGDNSAHGATLTPDSQVLAVRIFRIVAPQPRGRPSPLRHSKPGAPPGAQTHFRYGVVSTGWLVALPALPGGADVWPPALRACF
jgi:DNA repair protein RecO (recombination protein O)